MRGPRGEASPEAPTVAQARGRDLTRERSGQTQDAVKARPDGLC